MPVPGRKPKPEGQSRHRNKPTYDWVEVLEVPFEGGPKLPAKLPDGRDWPAMTKRWWATVSSMPHCALWTESDWAFALDSAVVAAAFHRGEMRAAAELRQRDKLLGTTFDARRDLRIRYVPATTPTEEGDADVARLDDYRAALG